MAGQRVTHGTTAVGQVSVVLNGVWPYLEIINWGTVPVMAVAQVTGVAAPTLSWKGDDFDVVPSGASVTIPVIGPAYDQGNPGTTNPGLTAYVFAQTAGSDFTIAGSNG